MKLLTNCENRSSNPLQEACSGFQEAACDSKICSETMGVKESRDGNLMRITEQSLELVRVVKEASRNSTFILLFNKPG
jgi:hypothetical protein